MNIVPQDPGAQPGKTDHAPDPTSGDLERICKDALAAVTATAPGSAPPAQQLPAAPPTSVWLSFSPMLAKACVCMAIPLLLLVPFINLVGQRAGIADLQIWVQKRRRKRRGDEAEYSGFIIETDLKATDPVALHAASGYPMPHAVWETVRGHRALFVLDRPVTKELLERIAREVALSIPGADPSSFRATQGQRLPAVIKVTPAGPVTLNYTAILLNPVPIDVETFKHRLPRRIARILVGALELTAGEREAVDAKLDELGIPAPAEPGSHLYASCPIEPAHSKRCCYVAREDSGRIRVTCLADHGGRGRRTWGEVELYAMATGNTLPVGHADPIADIPPTWAGIEYVREKAAAGLEGEPFKDELVEAAVDTWKLARAQYDLDRALAAVGDDVTIVRAPLLDAYLELYEQRVNGRGRAGAFRIFYDENGGGLRLLQRDTTLPLKVQGETLNPKTHLHEWIASLAYDIQIAMIEENGKKVAVSSRDINETFKSGWNKALAGHLGCLSELGFPKLRIFELPVAFVKSGLELDERTKCIVGTAVFDTKLGDPSFDVIGYFLGLFRAGRLPLATENDVRRMIMAIASPLLRHIAPGLLGCYWMCGGPGAGKDFLCELIGDIWETVVSKKVRSKFDISLTDDLEYKRTFFSAGSAVYGRVKEAGKREGLILALIRFVGTDRITARGMRLDEISIMNTFTVLAESAEDMPGRKEIARRAVLISVQPVDATRVSLGEVRAEILSHAGDIIAALKAAVEQHDAEWFTSQKDTGLRPVVPVALAKMFGAELTTVEGRDLDELYDAMVGYIGLAQAQAEGAWQQQNARKKDGELMKLFPSYRLAHFIDTMRGQPGMTQLFKEFVVADSIWKVVAREISASDRGEALLGTTRHDYVRVVQDKATYALKFIKANRNFILVPEDEFHLVLGQGPASRAAGAMAASAGQKAPAAALPAAPVTAPIAGPYIVPAQSMPAAGGRNGRS